MTDTVGQRIAENAARSFVGRAAELATLRAFFGSASAGAGPAPLVAVLHGPGGIGKTRVLRAALAELPDEVAVTLLEGRDVEPTPRGVCLALERALGRGDDTVTSGDVAAGETT